MKKIAIVGLGYVGLPLAVEFGKIRNVVGYDKNSKRISELSTGYDETKECTNEQLAEAIELKLSNKKEDIANAEIYIVTVPTPIDEAKRPDLSSLRDASLTIGSVLNKGNIVIYESTVFPGATEEICVPILEKASGLQFNEDFYCGYSPERINPGDKVNTLTKIKKITSGSTQAIADEIDELYGEIIEAGTWKASSIIVAEAAKVIENSQRDLNIAFVNELSLIFNNLGIDTLEVLEAAGSKWNFLPFKPGMVGGHCIGIDPYYLTHKAEQSGYNPEVILAGRRINDNMAIYAARSIVKKMLKNGKEMSTAKIGIFGITFKENCPDIRNSKVLDFVEELEDWSAKVVVSDPWANEQEVQKEYGIDLKKMSEMQNLDCLVFTVGHSEFRNLTVDTLKTFCGDGTIVIGDLKGIYSRSELLFAGFDVFRL